MQDWTALHHAVRYGYMHIVKILLAQGADVHAKDDEVTLPVLSHCEHIIRWQPHNTLSCLAL